MKEILTKSFILDMCANFHVSAIQIFQNNKDDDGYMELIIPITKAPIGKALKIAYNYHSDYPLSMDVCAFDFISCGVFPNEVPADVLKELRAAFRQLSKERTDNFYKNNQ